MVPAPPVQKTTLLSGKEDQLLRIAELQHHPGTEPTKDAILPDVADVLGFG
jgi:hypothetical protein